MVSRTSTASRNKQLPSGHKDFEKEKSLSGKKSQGDDVLESDYLGTFLAKARRTPDTFSVDDATIT